MRGRKKYRSSDLVQVYFVLLSCHLFSKEKTLSRGLRLVEIHLKHVGVFSFSNSDVKRSVFLVER